MRSHVAVLAVAAVALACAPAVRAQEQIRYGTYQKGTLPANHERVIYFLVEYTGEFDAKNSRAAAQRAVQNLKKSGETLTPGRYDIRTAADKHLVMGWHNLTRNETGWVAASTLGSPDRCAWLASDDPKVRHAAGWVKLSHQTNGFIIPIQFADDDRRNMAMCISRPQ